MITELDELHASQLTGVGYFEIANPELAKEYQKGYSRLLGETVYVVNGTGKYGVGQILFVASAAPRVSNILYTQLYVAKKLVETFEAAIDEFRALDIER